MYKAICHLALFACISTASAAALPENSIVDSTTPGLQRTPPEDNNPAFSTSYSNCYTYSGDWGLPNGVNYTRPLNWDSCSTLIAVQLPRIMQLNSIGYWNVNTPHVWDLGTSYPPHLAGECVVELMPTGPRYQQESSNFAPTEFVEAAKDVLNNCPLAGGYRDLDNYQRWRVRIYTRDQGTAKWP